VWMQVQRSNSATAYNLLLQPTGGNVGIGTTSPGTKLDVNGTTRATRYVSNTYTASLADTESAVLISGDYQGMLVWVSDSAGRGCLLAFGFNNWVIVSDPANHFSTTWGTDVKTNFRLNGGNVEVENQTGAAIVVYAVILG